MYEFSYRNNQLYCENVAVKKIAGRFDTPLYIYSRRTILDHYRKIKDAFRVLKPLICYSMKANSNIEICKLLAKQGAGLDIVSGGELFKALKAGVSPHKIVYAGIGKTEEEIKSAIGTNILLLNIESLPELEVVNNIAGRMRKRQRIAVRVNPNIKPRTHKYITTGHEGSKFGVDILTARSIFLNRAQFKNLDICGIHMHIGSQIAQARPFIKAIQKMVTFVKDLDRYNIEIKWFNIGGGLGIIYYDERPQTAAEYAREVLPLLRQVRARIILEPGRFIAGNSGILVTKVLYIKEAPEKNFAIVDAAMTDLIRPSLYNAYHEILPVISRPLSSKRKIRTYDVVGPVCESGDFLGRDRKFIGLREGDFLAVMGAGAYGYSMSSNYNSRPRAAEVLVSGDRVRLIRRRETYRDLIRTEV